MRAKGAAMRDLSSSQQEYYDERENEDQEGEGEEEEEEKEDGGEESAVRVAELSRRIASRCLHLEQECSRRERSQTRLFQEQLRGVRQVRVVAVFRACCCTVLWYLVKRKKLDRLPLRSFRASVSSGD